MLIPDLNTLSTSFAVLGLKVKQTSTKEWYEILAKYNRQPNPNPNSYNKKYGWKIRHKIQLPLGTTRELASALFQLKIGHGYFKAYLYRLGRSTSNRCRCG